VPRGRELRIKVEMDTGALEVRAEGIRGLERRETRVGIGADANLISYIKPVPLRLLDLD
jgi:hypothetical protein